MNQECHEMPEVRQAHRPVRVEIRLELLFASIFNWLPEGRQFLGVSVGFFYPHTLSQTDLPRFFLDELSERQRVSDTNSELIPLTSLTRKQRRVLGVLIEKAFTVPDQYPLTLKATTTGCNQKNNRDPVTNYDEDDVQETLEELQKLGFVGVVHTESGRTERYRHYMRMRTQWTAPQIAIMAELMLRGRQQLGELRTRASRMSAIDGQEDLRRELQGLMELKLVRSNGPLERRGIEVDHSLYPEGEKHDPLSTFSEVDSHDDDSGNGTSHKTVGVGVSRHVSNEATSDASNDRIESLESELRELKNELSSMRNEIQSLQADVADLRRQLGG